MQSHRAVISLQLQRRGGIARNEDRGENLRARIKRQISMGDTAVCVCYRPPDQVEEADEV